MANTTNSPIKSQQLLQLTELYIDKNAVKSTNITMESARCVVVREKQKVNIIDIKTRDVTKLFLTVDSAIMNPASNTLGLRRKKELEIFDVETKTRMKVTEAADAVLYWRWLDQRTIAYVTAKAVYHWSMEGDAAPVKKFDIVPEERQVQIIGYDASADGNWLFLQGIAKSAQDNSIEGVSQFYYVPRNRYQPNMKNAHIGCFTDLYINGRDAKLFCFIKKNGNTTKLFVAEMGNQDNPLRVQSEINFQQQNDFIVAMVPTSKYGCIYAISQQGTLFLYDIPTGQHIVSRRVSNTTVLLAVAGDKYNGLVTLDRNGQMKRFYIDDAACGPYVIETINDYAKLASCLVRFERFQEAVDAARKANSIQTWKDVCYACVDAHKFRLAQMCGVNIIVFMDHLHDLIRQYEIGGHFAELVNLLEQGINLDRAHQGIYTQLGILYAKYKEIKLLEYIKVFWSRLNIPTLLQACKDNLHWKETVFLYTHCDQFDNTADTMIQHSPTCWDHEQFKSLMVRVSNTEVLYRAINFYLREHPLYLNELLILIITKVDHKRVVQTIRLSRQLPLIQQYLLHVQGHNIAVVNEAVNELFVQEENFNQLRESIADYDEFDQIALAKQLQKHELLEFRRIAAHLYRANKRWTTSITLSKQDGLWQDAMETAALSEDKALAEELLRFFVENIKKDSCPKSCFAACLFTCFELIRPDVVLELAWRYGLTEYCMPFMVQTLRRNSDEHCYWESEITAMKAEIANLRTEHDVLQKNNVKLKQKNRSLEVRQVALENKLTEQQREQLRIKQAHAALEKILTKQQQERLRVQQAHEAAMEMQKTQEKAAKEALRSEMKSELAAFVKQNVTMEKNTKERKDTKEEKDLEPEPVVEAEWIKMDVVGDEFNETERSTNISIAVDKIANLVVSSLTAVASSGLMSSGLLESLKGIVVNAGWTQKCCRKKTAKHFHEGDIYIFLQLTKSVSSEAMGCMIWQTDNITISGETKILYMEAGNDMARKELAVMKRKRAEDVFSFINNLSGWSGK